MAQQLAQAIYPYWMLLVIAFFLGVSLWAFWPSRKRREQMDDYASIPFRDGDDKRDGAR